MPKRIAILADYAEENWQSMDLCADRLLAHLPTSLIGDLVQPPMKKRVSKIPWLARGGKFHIVDRLLNRQWDYPKYVQRQILSKYDFYHIVDHSYSNLALTTPAERSGIYCHDIDAFLCLVDAERDPRPRWFRAMARRILRGLQSARIIFHNSQQTRRELLEFGLVSDEKLVYAPLGVAEEFKSIADQEFGDLQFIGNFELRKAIESLNRGPWLLHVGSCIPRKRVDILLRVFAAARDRVPELKLLKIGGIWAPEHEAIIKERNLSASIHHILHLDRADLAECYRRATAVLVPSQSEGFGLPIIEAMACGAPVIASDIPVLRESGGTGAIFATFGDIDAWQNAVTRVLADDPTLPSRASRLAWASRFSWTENARIIAEAYLKLL